MTPPDADTADTVAGLEVEPDGGVPDLVNIATSLGTHRIGLFRASLAVRGHHVRPGADGRERRARRAVDRSVVFLLPEGDGTLSDGRSTPWPSAAPPVSTFSVGGDGAEPERRNLRISLVEGLSYLPEPVPAGSPSS